MHLADQNLRSLSDEDLIRHFCAHREDQGAAAELWKRHGETIRTFVKRHGKLRPRACPYEMFVDATFSRAYLNFLARICRFRFQGSFEGWLGKVALTAALDERRVLVGRKKTAEEPEGAAAHEGESPIGMLGQEEDLFRTQVPRVTLAVEVKDAMAILSETRAAQTPGAETVLAAKERKFLVRELLIRHAEASEEDAESSRTIRLRYWREWSVFKIAAYYFGEPMNKRQKDASERAIYRSLASDYAKLKEMVAKELGITKLEHV